MGEPPLLLSVSALSALQAAVLAAQQGLHGTATRAMHRANSPKSVLAAEASAQKGWAPPTVASCTLRVPASVQHLAEAIGGFSVGNMLREAMGQES